MTDLTQSPPLANDPGARTDTGTLKDQLAKTPPTTTTPPATTQDPATTESGDSKSLLNKDDKAPDKKADAPGAPEKYEPFTVPEGFILDEKVSGEASAIFKELGLPQASAQKLVDFYSAKQAEAAGAPYKLWNDLQAKWTDQIKADPEIGSKLPQVKETVGRALDALGAPALAAEFREAMDLTGAGNHPAFVKAFYKLAQMVTEGRSVLPGQPSPLGQKAPGSGPPSPAKALYPTLP